MGKEFKKIKKKASRNLQDANDVMCEWANIAVGRLG